MSKLVDIYKIKVAGKLNLLPFSFCRLFVLASLFLVIACTNQDANQSHNTQTNSDKEKAIDLDKQKSILPFLFVTHKGDSLWFHKNITHLKQLKLDAITGDELEKLLDFKKFRYLYRNNLDDPQYTYVKGLVPYAKHLETSKLVYLIFWDRQDYHKGYVMYIFQKKSGRLVSSFPIWRQGGDAEDFSFEKTQELGKNRYLKTYMHGHKTNIEDTCADKYIEVFYQTQINLQPSGFLIIDTIATKKKYLQKNKNCR